MRVFLLLEDYVLKLSIRVSLFINLIFGWLVIFFFIFGKGVKCL